MTVLGGQCYLWPLLCLCFCEPLTSRLSHCSAPLRYRLKFRKIVRADDKQSVVNVRCFHFRRQLLFLEVFAWRELRRGHVSHVGVGGTEPPAALGKSSGGWMLCFPLSVIQGGRLFLTVVLASSKAYLRTYRDTF